MVGASLAARRAEPTSCQHPFPSRGFDPFAKPQGNDRNSRDAAHANSGHSPSGQPRLKVQSRLQARFADVVHDSSLREHKLVGTGIFASADIAERTSPPSLLILLTGHTSIIKATS